MPLVYALSVNNEIEKIGSYAGFAAVVGLAVLALLYFSQAREVKRLREWAGRSPERAQELEQRVIEQAEMARQAESRRVVAQPQPPKPTAPASPATPGTAAGAAAAGAAAGTAATPPATPGAPRPAGVPAVAGATAPGADAKPVDAPAAAPEAKPGAAPVAKPAQPAAPGTPAATPAAGERPAAPSTAPATVAGGATVTSAPSEADSAAQNGTGEEPAVVALPPPAPAPEPVPARTAALRSASPSVTIPPRAPVDTGRRSNGDGHRRGWGTAGAILATLVLLGGAAAIAVVTLGGDGAPKEPNTPGPVDTSGGSTPTANDTSKKVPRGRVVVTVLNGTTVNGLAASVRDKVVAAGFKKGGAYTGSDQTRSATIIQYDTGYSDEARDLGKVLNVDAVEKLDASTLAVACPPGQCTVKPNVVVTVGADRQAE